MSSEKKTKFSAFTVFFHSSSLMNVLDLSAPEEDNDHKNIIQKKQAEMLTIKYLLWTHCVIIDFMEIFWNSNLFSG